MIDTLRKGNNMDPVPIDFREYEHVKKRLEQKEKARRKKKSLVDNEFDFLMKNVDYTAAFEGIKKAILENAQSTPWNLFVDIDRIKQDEAQTMEETIASVREELEGGAGAASSPGRSSTKKSRFMAPSTL